jgi:hypothetical protein
MRRQGKLFAVHVRRCRKLYEKYVEWDPTRCSAWARFAELERSLGETDRARAIYELAIAQPQLDMPEVRAHASLPCWEPAARPPGPLCIHLPGRSMGSALRTANPWHTAHAPSVVILSAGFDAVLCHVAPALMVRRGQQLRPAAGYGWL